MKQIIEQAIKNHNYLLIDYVDSKLKITRDRLIEPFEIKTRKKDGKLTLVAQCLLRNDLREFMLDGIQKVSIQNMTDYEY